MDSVKAILITLGFIVLGVLIITLGAILIPIVLTLGSAAIVGFIVYLIYIIVLEAVREQ